MKIIKTVTVTHVERTVAMKIPARCPHCGAELSSSAELAGPDEAKALPAAGEEDESERDESGRSNET
jgi:hypothetical protein